MSKNYITDDGIGLYLAKEFSASLTEWYEKPIEILSSELDIWVNFLWPYILIKICFKMHILYIRLVGIKVALVADF